MNRLIYRFFCAFVNPMLWVVTLAPVAVNISLRLVQADIVLTPTPTAPQGTLAAAIQSPHTDAVRDYSLQIFTVVLAFIFWVASLFSDGAIKFAHVYLSKKGENIQPNGGDKTTTKCAAYSVSALVVFLVSMLLFFLAGHLSVVAMYEPVVKAHPWYSSWLFSVWDAIGGPPPMASPLTWARIILGIHGLFRRSYQEWHNRLGLDQSGSS